MHPMDCDQLGTDGDRDAGAETHSDASADRDRLADARDEASEARGAAADARDRRAASRDDRAVTRERDIGGRDAGAASDRTEARRDRQGAADDRAEADADRHAASTDRVVAAAELAVSSIDQLTGARRRDAGTVELTREAARAARTGQPFVLAFVDVDGLKATNDSFGHGAGDQLLRLVADTIRANLRSYDLIVRFGGDEFVCGLTDLKMDEAAKRFAEVNATLEQTEQASVTVGLATLERDESLEGVIERADEALHRQRQWRPSART
jgi:diguanylate cyclase (GGDEF)-like protein